MKTQRSTTLILMMVIVLSCVPAVYSLEYYDHAEIGRYENSSVIHQELSNYSEYRLGLGAVQNKRVPETQTVEGKVMMTLYRGPDDASSFEIISAYRKLLQSKQYEILYACEKSACGENFLGAYYDLAAFANNPGWNNSAPITNGSPDFSYVLVAKSDRGGKLTYVSIIVSQGWWRYPVYKLDVVEVKEYEGKISSSARPGSETGSTDKAPSDPSVSPQVVRKKVRFGLQMSSDSFFGVVLYANRFELSAKVQSLLFDGFPASVRPDDVIMVGGHACYLFKPSDKADLGVGLDVRQGITLSGDTEYKQYLDGGLRISYNYHLGERFMISALLYPFWVSVRETEVADSYSLSARIPSASVAASFFFKPSCPVHDNRRGMYFH